MTTNGSLLGDVADLEEEIFRFAPKFYWKTELDFNTKPAILPNRCWTKPSVVPLILFTLPIYKDK